MQLASSQENLGERNRRVVLGEILLNGPIARTTIAERIGLTQASVSRITRDLIDANLIKEAEQYAGDSGRGRRFVALTMKPGGAYVVCIAINIFRQDIVIADLANNEIAQQKLQFDDITDPVKTLEACAGALQSLIQQTGIEQNLILGCAVTLTGAVDPDNGILRTAPVIGWSNVNVEKIVQSLIKVPVIVESIANAKAMAAYCFGPAKGVRNLALFNCSLALGLSLVIDGKLLRGADSSIGLVESMCVPDPATNRMSPVDKVAGGFGIVDTDIESPDSSGKESARELIDVIVNADNGSQAARDKLSTAGKGLAHALINTNALLHPELLIVSGPLIESDFYRDGVRSGLNEVLTEQLVSNKLRFFNISSHGGAQSLAIYQFLVPQSSQQNRLRIAEGF